MDKERSGLWNKVVFRTVNACWCAFVDFPAGISCACCSSLRWNQQITRKEILWPRLPPKWLGYVGVCWGSWRRVIETGKPFYGTVRQITVITAATCCRMLPHCLATNLNLVHIWLDLIISQYTVSEAMPSPSSLWQDSSSKTDLPEDLESQGSQSQESQEEDSGWLCPAVAAVDFAVEVVEAFLATLGKMCCHVLQKQIHVAASLSFGIIGDVRVCSNICWCSQAKTSSGSLAVYPYPYPYSMYISQRSTVGAQRLPKFLLPCSL